MMTQCIAIDCSLASSEIMLWRRQKVGVDAGFLDILVLTRMMTKKVYKTYSDKRRLHAAGMTLFDSSRGNMTRMP